jgi:predicted nucleic acid-binding protein
VGYLVIDTCVLTRLQGKYSKVFECIQRNGDIIATSKEARKEYEFRAKPSLLLLRDFLQELEDKNITRNFKRSKIETRLRQLERQHTIAYPNDNQDSKWVELAVSSGATHILSTDPALLNLPPNPCNNHTVTCIHPLDYLKERCPDIV